MTLNVQNVLGRHVPMNSTGEQYDDGGFRSCFACHQRWPCDALLLAKELEKSAPIEFDLRDLVVILDCLDADARVPWLIGAHELAPDRHRIAETIRSAINDANIGDVYAEVRE